VIKFVLVICPQTVASNSFGTTALGYIAPSDQVHLEGGITILKKVLQ